MKTVDGRDAITRKEWAERINRSDAEVRRLYSKRAENGHPEYAFRIGLVVYFWLDEMDAWWAKREAEVRPKPIERDGDPDELLFASGVAEVLGYSTPRTVLSMHNRGQFAEPDATVSGEGQKSGQPRPQWKRRTVWDWADSRGWVHKSPAIAAVDNPGQPD